MTARPFPSFRDPGLVLGLVPGLFLGLVLAGAVAPAAAATACKPGETKSRNGVQYTCVCGKSASGQTTCRWQAD